MLMEDWSAPRKVELSSLRTSFDGRPLGAQPKKLTTSLFSIDDGFPPVLSGETNGPTVIGAPGLNSSADEELPPQLALQRTKSGPPTVLPPPTGAPPPSSPPVLPAEASPGSLPPPPSYSAETAEPLIKQDELTWPPGFGGPPLFAWPPNPYALGMPLMGMQHSSPSQTWPENQQLPPGLAPSPVVEDGGLPEAPPPQPQQLTRAITYPMDANKLQADGEEPGLKFREDLRVQQQALKCDKDGREVRWTVDAKKLKGSDKVFVSPMFELPGYSGSFKLMIHAKEISERKGGASFKKAKGRGFICLKCEAMETETSICGSMTFKISIGGRQDDDESHSPRGPVTHNFEDRGVCHVPNNHEEWNFSKAVDEATQTFCVRLELLSNGGGPD